MNLYNLQWRTPKNPDLDKYERKQKWIYNKKIEGMYNKYNIREMSMEASHRCPMFG